MSFLGRSPSNIIISQHSLDAILNCLSPPVSSTSVVNENESQYFARNVKLAGLTPSVLSSDRAAFEESNRKRSINGRLFNNLDGIDVAVGDRARFYLLGWGSEVDLHRVVFQGNTLLYEEHRVDTVSWMRLQETSEEYPAAKRELVFQRDKT